jgi:cytochrome c553
LKQRGGDLMEVVMPELDPGIHQKRRVVGWIAGSSPAMTRREIMMRIAMVLMSAAALICGSSAHAADATAAKEKAELCVGCHGEAGISQTENIPSLAGQPDQFIQWQLVFFRAGSRKNEQMQPIVEAIDNNDIRNLGAYFAALAPPKASTPDDNPDLSAKGKQAAAGRRCASCHTDTFAGTKAVARIAGQREEYLVKALHDYKSGARSGGAGAAMADVAYPLSDEEIEALAHYLAHL